MSTWASPRVLKRGAVSVRKMRALDRHAIERAGIAGSFLMENAGRGIAEVALARLRPRSRVLVICGRGNNGGDGFVAARYLLARGIKVKVWMTDFPGRLSPDALTHFQLARRAGVDMDYLKRHDLKSPAFHLRMRSFQWVIDALLGTGLKKPPREPYRTLIRHMNMSGRPILAVDVPSGLDADRGVSLGTAVHATLTATCGYAKKGFFLREGPRHVGRLFLIDIGLPPRR